MSTVEIEKQNKDIEQKTMKTTLEIEVLREMIQSISMDEVKIKEEFDKFVNNSQTVISLRKQLEILKYQKSTAKSNIIKLKDEGTCFKKKLEMNVLEDMIKVNYQDELQCLSQIEQFIEKSKTSYELKKNYHY